MDFDGAFPVMGALHPFHFQDHPGLFARGVDEAVLSVRLFPVSGNKTPLHSFRVGPVAVIYELGILGRSCRPQGSGRSRRASDVLFVAFLVNCGGSSR